MGQQEAVEPADFARLTGRSTESVAKLFTGDAPVSPRDETAKRILREMIQLQNVLQAVGLTPDEMKTWMHASLPSFDGKTPKELIAEGAGRKLVARLLAYASGNVATCDFLQRLLARSRRRSWSRPALSPST